MQNRHILERVYSVENRQPIGYDKNAPDSGVLIMFADDTVPECRHGRSPVKLVDANPKIPHLAGAAYDIGKNDRYVDEKNKVKIRLLEKKDNSYKIIVAKVYIKIGEKTEKVL